LERIEQNSEDNDWDFLAEPSKEVWSFLADRFELLSKLAHISLKKIDKLWESRDISTITSREKLTVKYMVNERNCLACFAEITANRRDKGSEDELPSPVENVLDETVFELADKTKAFLKKAGHYGDGMVTRGELQVCNCKSFEVVVPVSTLHVPNPRTE